MTPLRHCPFSWVLMPSVSLISLWISDEWNHVVSFSFLAFMFNFVYEIVPCCCVAMVYSFLLTDTSPCMRIAWLNSLTALLMDIAKSATKNTLVYVFRWTHILCISDGIYLGVELLYYGGKVLFLDNLRKFLRRKVKTQVVRWMETKYLGLDVWGLWE